MRKPAILLVSLVITTACAQTSVTSANVLTLAPEDRTLQAKAGATFEAKLPVELKSGYHVNSNTPSEDYLIPLRLTWNASALGAAEVVFPKPKLEHYSFSKVPLSVFTDNFAIVTRFKVPTEAAAGPVTLTGKLRFQACNTKMCLPPKTLDVKLPIEIAR